MMSPPEVYFFLSITPTTAAAKIVKKSNGSFVDEDQFLYHVLKYQNRLYFLAENSRKKRLYVKQINNSYFKFNKMLYHI